MKVNGSRQRGTGERAGCRALALLGTPPNALVLRTLAEAPTGLADLQVRVGSPGSTLRARLGELVEAEVVARRRTDGQRGSAEYELTPAGEDLFDVLDALEEWLEASPGVARPLGSEGARAAIGALGVGWTGTLLRALAAGPLSLAELDSLIAGFSYPALERRIAAMRLAGQVEPRPDGRETPYVVTAWLRRGVAPLLAAIRWEGLHLGTDRTPVEGIDVEAILLLAVPLLSLEPGVSGSCRLAVELSSAGGGGRKLAGVLASVRGGAVMACTSRLDGEADAWVSGSLATWLAALAEPGRPALETGGDGRLAGALVDGLRAALFGTPPAVEASY